MRWTVVAAWVLLAGAAYADEVPQCSRWTAEMLEDEGGPVLAASSCATDAPDVYLTLYCAGDTILLRYDLANGVAADPATAPQQSVTFAFGDESVSLDLRYEEMDGQFATDFPATDPMVGLLENGSEMTVSVADDKYSPRHFSLAGSSAALGKLLAQCN